MIIKYLDFNRALKRINPTNHLIWNCLFKVQPGIGRNALATVLQPYITSPYAQDLELYHSLPGLLDDENRNKLYSRLEAEKHQHESQASSELEDGKRKAAPDLGLFNNTSKKINATSTFRPKV